LGGACGLAGAEECSGAVLSLDLRYGPTPWTIRSTERREMMNEQKNPKYETPRIVDHGELSELTAGLTTGLDLDASFPIGTPDSDLTFSGKI
jgi:hypothetical protein